MKNNTYPSEEEFGRGYKSYYKAKSFHPHHPAFTLIDVKERLPVTTTYQDLTFEASSSDYYDVLFKDNQIVIFNKKVLKA